MSTATPLRDRRGRLYAPAVSNRLKRLLAVIFAVVALLGANSVYLVAITVLGEEYQNEFYMLMFLTHLVLGLALILPFLVFALGHLRTAFGRPNRRAVRAGIALLAASLLLILSGLVLVRFGGFAVKDPKARSVAYWLHVLCPLAAIAFYVGHRLAGPWIKWRWAGVWAAAVAVFVLAMGYLHHQDPRLWYASGPREGARYFEPSAARTSTGNFIPARALLMDSYCKKCHPDAFEQHYQSVHHFSSFNNRPYLSSVTETRRVSLEREGTVQGSRWCAGCHDPVPFFSGRFDDPHYDIKDTADPTTQAGITCTTCHAITNINSVTGNAAYTIEEPQQYPFAFSDNPFLQWVNNQLVKAKPELHRKTFLKPFHRSTEFCSTCHKVSLPYALTHYKEWLRGQNHYDTFLLSGVSGVGARSFYYPEHAKNRCADCHMPLAQSGDFGARDFDRSGTRKIHSHFQLGANTGLPLLRNFEMLRAAGHGATPNDLPPDQQAEYQRNERIIRAHQEFLRDGQVRVDIFGLKTGGTIDGELIAPLRPEAPALRPGGTYLVEVVLRTLKLGHPFTQGTADSNEVWVDFEARSGDRVLGRSGAIDERGEVDPWSHFVNALVIDRAGNRIDRRNAQDIYTSVYNHQIPPGAAQVVHYLLHVPEDAAGTIELAARLKYRKFDRTYMEHVYAELKMPIPQLPVTTMAEDHVTLGVAGDAATVSNEPSQAPEWQRWNDYGIGLFRGLVAEGEPASGSEKGELRQAEQAFRKVVELGYGDGYANLARIYLKEKRLDDAVAALRAAASPGEAAGASQVSRSFHAAPAWTIAWLTGLVNQENGYLDEAIRAFEAVLSGAMHETVAERGFEFRRDYVIWRDLGLARAERAEQERGARRQPERDRWLQSAADAFDHVLAIDPEDYPSHFKLSEIFATLARDEPASGGAAASHAAPDRDTPVTPAELHGLAAQLADRAQSADARRGAADALVHQIPSFLAGRRDAFESRRIVLADLLATCRPAYPDADDGVTRAAARLLRLLHAELHEIYKPDDNAHEMAAVYRQKHPAANHAAQSIVIYPLNRDASSGVARRADPPRGDAAPAGGE